MKIYQDDIGNIVVDGEGITVEVDGGKIQKMNGMTGLPVALKNINFELKPEIIVPEDSE